MWGKNKAIGNNRKTIITLSSFAYHNKIQLDININVLRLGYQELEYKDSISLELVDVNPLCCRMAFDSLELIIT